MRRHKKKNPYRSIPIKHRLDVLKRRYAYDEESRTFDIVLHYERVSELFEARLDHANVPVLNDDAINMISDQLSYIPYGYKAKFSLVIDDFEEYEPNVVLSAFNEQVRALDSLFEIENKKQWTKIGVLLVVGLFFIVVTIVGEVDGWWIDTDVSLRLINYFLDTLGCVLIWEGIYAALLDSSDLLVLGHRLNTRFGGLNVYKGESQTPCSSEDNEATLSLTKRKFHKRFAAICLLIAAFGFFLTGAIDIVLAVNPIVTAINTGKQLAFAIILPFVELVITGMLGYLTLRLFYGDYRILGLHWVLYFLFLAAIILDIYLMANGLLGGGEIVANVLSLLGLIFYTLGFLISFIDYRKEKRKGNL